MSPTAYALAWEYLRLRDGEECANRCGKPITKDNPLTIQHINGRKDSRPQNLCFLCKSCNTADGNKSRSRLQFIYDLQAPPTNGRPGGRNGRGRGRAIDPNTNHGRLVKETAGYYEGESTQKANFLFETDLREWVLKEVWTNGFIALEKAIYGGAEEVQCSPKTAKEYVRKMYQDNGPLQLNKDMFKAPVLVTRKRTKS